MMKYLLLVVMDFYPQYESCMQTPSIMTMDSHIHRERENLRPTGKVFDKKTIKMEMCSTQRAEHGRRDYVAQLTDGLTGHEWCMAYEPWSEGLTFAMIPMATCM